MTENLDILAENVEQAQNSTCVQADIDLQITISAKCPRPEGSVVSVSDS